MTPEAREQWRAEGPGDCYRQAADMAETLSRQFPPDVDIHVVHGLVTGNAGDASGLRFGHAWVEVNHALCFDAPRGEPVILRREVYYATGDIKPGECYRYTLSEARREMVETGIYGPWHDAGRVSRAA